MHRCFVDPSGWRDGAVFPPPDEQHHLLHVVRANAGDSVTVFDGKGRQASAIIREADDGETYFEIVERGENVRPSVRVALIQALPRSKKMDLIVEKATELGADAIIPVQTARSISRLDQRQAAAKRDRWTRVARSAAKQCGTDWVPTIAPVQDLSTAMDAASCFDLLLVGSLDDDARPFADVLAEAKTGAVARVGIVVGPEGDLTRDELAMCGAAGARPVSFGGLVLRVETAAIYALSVLAYEFPGSS